MRALLKKDANIIQIPEEDFARLEKITQDGFFIYKVKYRVNPVKAIRSKALQVRISATIKPSTKQSVRTFTNFNPQLIHRRLRQRRAISKDLNRKEKPNKLFTTISDITKKIPNNQTTRLARSKFTSPPTIKTQLKIKPALVQDVRNRNLSLPVFEKNVSRTPAARERTSKSIRLSSSQLLTKTRKDPASIVGRRTNSISTARKAIKGTTPRRTATTRSSVSLERPLVSSLLNQRNVSNQIQLRNNEFVNVLTKERNTFVEVEETLRIPIGDITESEFFLTFELENNKELNVQTISKAVPHNKNISRLQIPVEAPEVSALPVGSLGRTVLNVKQKDENATVLKIYRRLSSKGNPNIDAEYDFVGSIDITKGEGFKKIEDIFASSNPIIYRAIPFNDEDIPGADFSSVVVEQRSKVSSFGKAFRRQPYFLTLTHEIQERSIVVSVRNISPGPFALKLLRKDLTIKQQNFTQIGNIEVIDRDSNIPIIFQDDSVKENRIYEYRVQLLYASGSEEIAANNLVVEYTPVTSNILELELSEPNVEQNGNDIDVTFDITKNIIQTEGDLIKSFLEEQGLTTEFQDELLANRDKLQDLFAVRVTRTNLTTGELEDFGVISSPNFSDQKFGRVRSVKPLQGGFEYQYNVTAHARDIETLFPSLSKSVTTRVDASHTFSPYKWKHPITLSEGNVITDRTLVRNHSKTTFTFGKVVDFKITTVSLADIIPSLSAGKATKLGESEVLVQWKVQGNVNKIDHFIVILDILGMRTVVGKSHNITSSNYFQLIDKLTNEESGQLTYFIVPVFFDYSRGPELKTNSVII